MRVWKPWKLGLAAATVLPVVLLVAPTPALASYDSFALVATCDSCGGGPANIALTGAAQELPTAGSTGDVNIPFNCDGVIDNVVVATTVSIGLHCWMSGPVIDGGTGVNGQWYDGYTATENALATNVPGGYYNLCVDGGYIVNGTRYNIQAYCSAPI